jgi:hypothetical protein
MKKLHLTIPIILTVLIALPCMAWAAAPVTFTAHLTGGQEVPPVKTKATGEATFNLSQDGQSLHYKLSVANLIGITMAHIHLGPPGKNGLVAVWLYPSHPYPELKLGKFSGILAEGTITAKNLVGPLSGKPLQALIKDMESGRAYVNVHSRGHPEGEIRGEIGMPGKAE